MEWQPDGSVGFRDNNGKFVATKKSGHLFANTDAVEDSSKFFFYLINRLIVAQRPWPEYSGGIILIIYLIGV